MYDTQLVHELLVQIKEAIETIQYRSNGITSVDQFTNSPAGMEKLDSICMLFVAIGEALKNIDKVSQSKLLSSYPEIDWRGIMGFRDIIAHHYFDVDAEQVLWICTNKVKALSTTLAQMISDLETTPGS